MTWCRAVPWELDCFILMEDITNPISLFALAPKGAQDSIYVSTIISVHSFIYSKNPFTHLANI